MSDYDYDVAIVGGGGAGMAAALAAKEAGAQRVIIAEADNLLGGSTRLSGGVFYAAGTSVQAEAGVHGDTADAMFDYYMTLNQWRVESSLARTLCDQAAPALEWLIECGVYFPPEDLYSSGVEGIARGHAPLGFGAAITAALEGLVEVTDIDVAIENRVEGLLIEGGQVVGIRARGEDLRARSVVLTTGGFGQSPKMLARHYPESSTAGEWLWSISAKHCVGDGLTLGQEAGAAITGHDRGLLLITPGFARELEVDPPGWLVFLGPHGRRFVDESAPYAVMAGTFKEQGGRAFAFFDEASRREAKPDSKYADAFAAGIVAVNFLPDFLSQMIDEGKVHSADTLGELAGKLGLPVEAVQSSLDAYNGQVEAGADTSFFKNPAHLRPVLEAPFHAVEMRPAIVCLTSTGVRIDTQAHVVGENGQLVPGLYAAGETTGGVLGDRYIGGGNSVANAIVFGRIAGMTAAREAATRS